MNKIWYEPKQDMPNQQENKIQNKNKAFFKKRRP